jgi:ketosteroid isomerase-like protein
MSENLDVVRSIYANWERGDYSSTEWAHPDIEFCMIDGPEPGRWSGVTAMGAAWQRVLSGFVGFGTAGTRYEELKDGRVLAFTRFTGQAKLSGLDLSRMPGDQAAIFDIRNGRVTRIALHWDTGRLRDDLGLKE